MEHLTQIGLSLLCVKSTYKCSLWSQQVHIEVSLLTSSTYPNIVSAIECYVSLCTKYLVNLQFIDKSIASQHRSEYRSPWKCLKVMEKHGTGMDLFELVDRRPKANSR